MFVFTNISYFIENLDENRGFGMTFGEREREREREQLSSPNKDI